MIANYHTHTFRCGHARGTEREYVETAIARGVKILGFADHAPHVYLGGYESKVRMSMNLLENYVDTVNGLKKEYTNDIEIHLGLEAEYYPDYFESLLKCVEDYKIEYLLLGQHYLGNEIGEPYITQPKDDTELLIRYCRQVTEAMETGVFAYFAHPDVIRDMGEPEIFTKEMRKLCQNANRCGLMLEINLLGIRDNRHYPNEAFWKIAGEEGCRVILGADAHAPEDVCRTHDIARAHKLVEKYNLKLVDTITLG